MAIGFESFLKENLPAWASESLGADPDLQLKIISTFLAFFFVWFLQFAYNFIVLKRIDDIQAQYKWRKAGGYVITVIAILIIGRIWFEGFGSIATFLGLISAGLTIALKDIVTDVAGWLFIIWKRPFQLSDRIQIGAHTGDVIDITTLQFTLMEVGGDRLQGEQSTGRMIHVPNGWVFSQALLNFTKGFEYIWDEVPIEVTFESDYKKAKQILEEVINKHALELSASAEKRIKFAARKFMLSFKELKPKIYTSIAESGVKLSIRYLCHPQQKRNLREAIYEDILEEFSKHVDIDFAYPTRRVFNHEIEGKEALAKESQ